MDRTPSRPSRRRFVRGVGVAGLALAAGCGRLPWQGQPPARVPRVGWLDPANTAWDADFRQGLLDHGYVEGQNIALEWRRGESEGQLPALATELVELNVDVIVARGAPAAEAAKAVTSTIPIVMALSDDPVEAGLVASLARPGGNVTGLSTLSARLYPKRLELLKEAVPAISRVGVVWNPASAPPSSWRELPSAARVLGVELQSLEAQEPGDFEALLRAVARERTEALLVFGGPFTSRHAAQLAEFARRSQLPAMTVDRTHAVDGLLMAYGPDLSAMVRRSAVYVDKIVKGASPADLPIEQPTKFDFAINLKTAQALGLSIPPHVLLQATELIQ